MTSSPRLSAIIPTRDRPAHLSTLLRALAQQHPGTPAFEVIVVLDGPDEASHAAALPWSGRLDLRVLQAPRQGIAVAKNLAIEAARGELLLLLNDDVRPAPGFIDAHARAQDAAAMSLATPRPMIVGYSPFERPPPSGQPTLFDALIRRTSLIFFYDRMIDDHGRPRAGPSHDWGFRHAWNLNLSLRRDAALEVGGFRPAIANCCFEDVEFAWRYTRAHGAPVLFCPDALAPHDHRYTLEDYLAREWRLGYSAFGFAHAAPDAARAVFAEDLASPASGDYARAFIERESRAEPGLLTTLRAAALLPDALEGTEAGATILGLMHGQQVLLKRLAFRRGLESARAGERFPGLFHPLDGLQAEPPLAPRAPAPGAPARRAAPLRA